MVEQHKHRLHFMDAETEARGGKQFVQGHTAILW